MSKPTAKVMAMYPQLYGIKPEDFESVFNNLSTGQLPNLNVLSGDIVSVVRWVRQKLGEPILPVQMTNDQIAVCYEEAYLQFSYEVTTLIAQNHLLDLYGKDKYTNLTDKAPHASFNFFYDTANYFADQSIVGGVSDIHRAYIATTGDVQSYNILDNGYRLDTNEQLRTSFVQKKMVAPIQIIKVYYDQPVGYYSGFNNADINNLGLAVPNISMFGINTYSQIFPNWDNYLWKQHAKTFSEMQRSQYRYDLHGEYIDFVPAPRDNGYIFFEYRENSNGYTGSVPAEEDNYFNNGVSTIANIPLHELAPELINSIGRMWIRKYCLALSKELLGLVRNTFTSGIKLPTGDDVTLNGDQLISDGKEEQSKLIDDLRVTLEKFDVAEMMDRKLRQIEAMDQINNRIPLPIFIG